MLFNHEKIQDGYLDALDGGYIGKDVVPTKYGVTLCFTHPGEVFWHMWIVTDPKQGDVIGNGELVHWLGSKKYEDYFITKEGREKGKFDEDLIVSRGIARYLSQCKDLEEAVSKVPQQVWDAFPGLLPFIQKHNDKLVANENSKSTTQEEKRRKETKLEEEMCQESMNTDFTVVPAEQKS